MTDLVGQMDPAGTYCVSCMYKYFSTLTLLYITRKIKELKCKTFGTCMAWQVVVS